MAIFGRKCCEACAEQASLLREIRNEVRAIRRHIERPASITFNGGSVSGDGREIVRELRRLSQMGIKP